MPILESDGDSRSISTASSQSAALPTNVSPKSPTNLNNQSGSAQSSTNTSNEVLASASPPSSTEDKSQPNSQSDGGGKFFWNGIGNKTLFGLPPACTEYMNSQFTVPADSIFKNSFPILTLKPVKLNQPEKSQGPLNTSPLADEVKFAVKVEGGVGYSISNEYGSSMIEDSFTNLAQFDALREVLQVAKSSRTANLGLDGARQLADKFNLNLGDVKKEFQNLEGSFDKYAGDNPFGKAMLNVGTAAIRGLIGGQKIDIPNIWKGSSSSISQTVTISLHCWPVTDEALYNMKIIFPLKILMRLAFPYSEKGKGGGEILYSPIAA